eukprot:489088_1
MLSFLWCILFIEAVISSSDDTSDSSSGSNENKYILDGEYRSAQQPGLGFSVCTAENGNIYGTTWVATGDPITSYISVYGRSTPGMQPVTEISPGVFQTKLDVFQFKSIELGVNRLEGVFTKNTNTGITTLSFTGIPNSTLILTQQPGKPQKCLIPDGNWNDTNAEAPFMVAYDGELPSMICPSGVSRCTYIERYENTVKDGGACFGWYDLDNKQFASGGTIANNVQIMWGGELRISQGVNVDVSADCASATLFHILTEEEEQVTVSLKCATSSAGATSLLSVDADVLDDIEEKQCPLFTGDSSNANKMHGQNVLGNDENVVNETIVINFSNATIGSLWAILIVFALVTVRMCWFWKKK